MLFVKLNLASKYDKLKYKYINFATSQNVHNLILRTIASILEVPDEDISNSPLENFHSYWSERVFLKRSVGPHKVVHASGFACKPSATFLMSPESEC